VINPHRVHAGGPVNLWTDLDHRETAGVHDDRYPGGDRLAGEPALAAYSSPSRPDSDAAVGR